MKRLPDREVTKIGYGSVFGGLFLILVADFFGALQPSNALMALGCGMIGVVNLADRGSSGFAERNKRLVWIVAVIMLFPGVIAAVTAFEDGRIGLVKVVIHPKSGELIENVPYGWPFFEWAKSDWYATPGYGKQHIEYVDLYLIAVDMDSGSAVVFHEWVF